MTKYYDNGDPALDDCVVNLYDVQPTLGDDGNGNIDYDYLSEAGHRVSLYLTTAHSDTPTLQEGTYTASDIGKAGTYEPGSQVEFMETMQATGTFCEQRNDNYESVYGFINSGTVTVTKAGDGYRFVLDFTTDKGYKISGTYEGSVYVKDGRYQ